MQLTLLDGVQEYEIECPDTKSLFSLKTGEITSWCAFSCNHVWTTMPGRSHLCGVGCRYPTNPVLRAITPKDTARALDVFPVKLTQVPGSLGSTPKTCHACCVGAPCKSNSRGMPGAQCMAPCSPKEKHKQLRKG